jgi:Spy/CpxP family protein refolding chaperone
MKSLLKSTLILALLACPLAAQPGKVSNYRMERISQALNLTETQKASIQAIREQHRPDLLLRRDALKQARMALRTSLQDAATPEAQLRALYDKASAARFDMLLTQRSVRLEVQALLTPEQRIKAAELRGRAQERRHERMRRLQMRTGMDG